MLYHLVCCKFTFYEIVEKFQNRKMEDYNYGDCFRREESSSSRPRRSVSHFRPSYNEALLTPTFGEDDCGDANASIFPCATFMTKAGIQDDFISLVTRCGLLDYMADESPHFPYLQKPLLIALSSITECLVPLLISKSMIRPILCPWKSFVKF